MGTVEARVTIWHSLSVGTNGVEASLALEASTVCTEPGVPLLNYCEGTWGGDQDQEYPP